GFGPPVAQQPTQTAQPSPVPPQPSYQVPHPSQGHGPAQGNPHAYAPTQMPAQSQTYPGSPVPQAPQRPEGSGKRRAVTAIAAALVLGVVAGGTLYFLLKNNGKEEQAGGSTGNKRTSDTAGNHNSGKEAESKPSTKPQAKPVEYKGINLTAGYHLTLGDDDVRPQQGEDGGYELSYDTGGYLDAETTGGSLALLDPGQEGSLEACRADTRFTETIYLNTVSKGRQICVTTGTGHMGLVTIQGLSGEESPSKYLTLDLTVWRNAAGSGSSSGS
ncbi:serine/threonine protein kinase, partial [Streptomyces sp. Wh19]|nr:serine/threonine protein kinase [Streptomyces sp. Wh19]